VNGGTQLLWFPFMKRDLQAMGGKTYDVLVVGCGIYGAFTAREAALRGLSVAVIDRKDFCGATSANSLKIIHGGLRYLQQLDVARVLESAKERYNLMRIAPHLVHPLPCAMPTRGFFMRSKPVMFAGMILNDIITCDRNQDIDPEKTIPRGRVISRDEFTQIVPGIDDRRFNGAAVWHDALCYNTERLAVIAVKAAVQGGADAANYTEMVKFARDGRRVSGAVVRDAFTGEEVTIKARLVINNTGPWTNETLGLLGEPVTLPVTGLAPEAPRCRAFRLQERGPAGAPVVLCSFPRQDDGRNVLPSSRRTCRAHAGDGPGHRHFPAGPQRHVPVGGVCEAGCFTCTCRRPSD